MDSHFGHLEEQGYVVRPARLDDLPQALMMFNAAEAELIGAPMYSLERYEQEWRYPGFDLETDTRLVLAPDGKPVGCVEVWTLLDPPVHPWIWARVHPEWRGRGIGTAMMAWSLTRARKDLDRVPPHARFAPRVAAPRTHGPSTALFTDFGFQPARHSWTMVIDLQVPPPAPLWPAGIRLRPFRNPQDLEAVYSAVTDSFRDHWGYVEVPFDQGFQQWRHAAAEVRPLIPDLWFLAVDGEEIAGIALCREQADDDPAKGWVDTLGVRRPWRRRGLGLALLRHAFAVLRANGSQRAGLGVDAASLTGATRLYTKAGMRVQRESTSHEIEIRSGEELGTTG
jgi:mycothiol synthase